MNQGYKKFIEDCLKEIEGKDKKNFIFKLKRHSKEIPFWIIFFCDKSFEVTQIIGSYGLDSEEVIDTNILLATLADSGIFTKFLRDIL